MDGLFADQLRIATLRLSRDKIARGVVLQEKVILGAGAQAAHEGKHCLQLNGRQYFWPYC